MSAQKYTTVTTFYTNPSSVNVGPVGVIDHVYRRDLGNITSTSVYTNFWKITLHAFYTCEMEVWVNGTLSGVGPIASYRRVALTSGGGALTATTQSTYDTGSTPNIQFDVATTSGSVYIGVEKPATGTAVIGSIELRMRGLVQTVAPV
jgi:hypothetical protein